MTEIQPIKNFRDYKRELKKEKKNNPDLHWFSIALYLEPRFYDDKAEKKIRAKIERKMSKYISLEAKMTRHLKDPMLDKISIKNFDDFKREFVKQKRRHPDKSFMETSDELSKHFQSEDAKSSVLNELRMEADKYSGCTENKTMQLKIALYEIWNLGMSYVYDFDDFRWNLIIEKFDNPDCKLTDKERELTQKFYKKDETDTYARQDVKDVFEAAMEKYPRINSAEALLEKIFNSAPEYEKNIVVFDSEYPSALYKVLEKI